MSAARQAAKAAASFASVKAVVVLDGDGKRLHAKYYAPEFAKRPATQQALEEKLMRKKKDAGSGHLDANVVLLDGTVSVFRTGSDGTVSRVARGVPPSSVCVCAVCHFFLLFVLVPGLCFRRFFFYSQRQAERASERETERETERQRERQR